MIITENSLRDPKIGFEEIAEKLALLFYNMVPEDITIYKFYGRDEENDTDKVRDIMNKWDWSNHIEYEFGKQLTQKFPHDQLLEWATGPGADTQIGYGIMNMIKDKGKWNFAQFNNVKNLQKQRRTAAT